MFKNKKRIESLRETLLTQEKEINRYKNAVRRFIYLEGLPNSFGYADFTCTIFEQYLDQREHQIATNAERARLQKLFKEFLAEEHKNDDGQDNGYTGPKTT
jgi:hypothetical protein